MRRIRLTARMAIGQKELMEEISLHNRICQYQDINKKNRPRKASMPEVGVFWVDTATGKVYASKTILREALDTGPCKIHPHGHMDVWNQIAVKNPKWRGVQYEDIPRGRVVYIKDPHNPKFSVVMAKELKAAKFKSAVTNAFSLPAGHVEFDFTDPHYEIFEY